MVKFKCPCGAEMEAPAVTELEALMKAHGKCARLSAAPRPFPGPNPPQPLPYVWWSSTTPKPDQQTWLINACAS